MSELLIIFFCLFPSDPKGVPVIKGKNIESQLKFTETVDLIEINTCHAYFTQEFNRWEVEAYVPCYQQVIFYDWNEEYSRYHVKNWAMIAVSSAIYSTEERKETQRPRNKWYGGLKLESQADFIMNKVGEYYVVTVNIDGNRYSVQSKSLILTDTDVSNDPERMNKKVLEDKDRIHLAKPIRKTQ